MHQHIGARLLHGLHSPRGGCGFLQQGGGSVQDIAVVHMAIERGYCTELDHNIQLGGYIGRVAVTKRRYCRDPVREYE